MDERDGLSKKADSSLRYSQAVPDLSTNRALSRLNFGGQKRSGAFDSVWPSANVYLPHKRRSLSRVSGNAAMDAPGAQPPPPPENPNILINNPKCPLRTLLGAGLPITSSN